MVEDHAAPRAGARPRQRGRRQWRRLQPQPRRRAGARRPRHRRVRHRFPVLGVQRLQSGNHRGAAVVAPATQGRAKPAGGTADQRDPDRRSLRREQSLPRRDDDPGDGVLSVRQRVLGAAASHRAQSDEQRAGSLRRLARRNRPRRHRLFLRAELVEGRTGPRCSGRSGIARQRAGPRPVRVRARTGRRAPREPRRRRFVDRGSGVPVRVGSGRSARLGSRPRAGGLSDRPLRSDDAGKRGLGPCREPRGALHRASRGGRRRAAGHSPDAALETSRRRRARSVPVHALAHARLCAKSRAGSGAGPGDHRISHRQGELRRLSRSDRRDGARA